MEMAEVSRILGGREAHLGRLENQLDLIECSRQGLAKAALVHLAAHLSLTVGQLAELLPISERTLQRHAATDRLNGTVSEQLLQIAAVAARGEEVFGDKERFLSWLNQPSKPLADKTPLGLLSSRFGAAMVLDELGRMEHGVFA